jgi:hypothetical protein
LKTLALTPTRARPTLRYSAHKNAHLLDREDMEAAALVQKAFIREGIALGLNARITRVERRRKHSN